MVRQLFQKIVRGNHGAYVPEFLCLGFHSACRGFCSLSFFYGFGFYVVPVGYMGIKVIYGLDIKTTYKINHRKTSHPIWTNLRGPTTSLTASFYDDRS